MHFRLRFHKTMLKHITSNLKYYAANIFFLSLTCHRFVLIPLLAVDLYVRLTYNY